MAAAKAAAKVEAAEAEVAVAAAAVSDIPRPRRPGPLPPAASSGSRSPTAAVLASLPLPNVTASHSRPEWVARRPPLLLVLSCVLPPGGRGLRPACHSALSDSIRRRCLEWQLRPHLKLVSGSRSRTSARAATKQGVCQGRFGVRPPREGAVLSHPAAARVHHGPGLQRGAGGRTACASLRLRVQARTPLQPGHHATWDWPFRYIARYCSCPGFFNSCMKDPNQCLGNN